LAEYANVLRPQDCAEGWIKGDCKGHRANGACGMNTPAPTNNERLRELVVSAGITQPVALTLFNRGLGPAAYSESAWKAFLSNPETTRFRHLNDELLAHAEKVFAKLQK
jgi:hypothetical protein